MRKDLPHGLDQTAIVLIGFMNLFLQFIDGACDVVVMSGVDWGFVGNDTVVGDVEVFLPES